MCIIDDQRSRCACYTLLPTHQQQTAPQKPVGKHRANLLTPSALAPSALTPSALAPSALAPSVRTRDTLESTKAVTRSVGKSQSLWLTTPQRTAYEKKQKESHCQNKLGRAWFPRGSIISAPSYTHPIGFHDEEIFVALLPLK